MSGTWQSLLHQPTFQVSTMLLLSNGTVMVQEEATPHWHALTPDDTGSYVNGTWSSLKDMSFWRRYYASGMLKSGKIVLIGGEQSGAGGDTNKGEIYDPVSDTWNPMPSPPGWSTVGDAACNILPDGRLMIGALFPSTACAIYDPVSNSWSAAASKVTSPNEETWIQLPDRTIVTVQCWAPFQTEKYIISSDTWQNEGPLPVAIVDQVMHEIGPGMLMYNGKVIFFGAANSGGHGKTVIYDPPGIPNAVGTWAAGPDIPNVGGQTMVCNDCPGSLLPNGHVLFTSAPFVSGYWGSPVSFFEYDPVSNSISQAPTPPNNGNIIYMSRLMLLPTGQVLFGVGGKNLQVYTPHGSPHDAWRPTIHAVHSLGGGHYLLKGTQLNGLSQANIYGDDCYPATNYPLVRLKNEATHKVYYCRTYDFSSMGVATGGILQSVRFQLPNLPHGHYDLCVVANGISSHCVDFPHHRRRKHEHAEKSCCKPSCTCSCCDPCCCPEDRMDEAEVRELQEEVRRLRNSVHRLTSMVQKEDVHEKKEANKDRDRKREDREDDDERGRGREQSKKR